MSHVTYDKVKALILELEYLIEYLNENKILKLIVSELLTICYFDCTKLTEKFNV